MGKNLFPNEQVSQGGTPPRGSTSGVNNLFGTVLYYFLNLFYNNLNG